jgi:hypothetical protein
MPTRTPRPLPFEAPEDDASRARSRENIATQIFRFKTLMRRIPDATAEAPRGSRSHFDSLTDPFESSTWAVNHSYLVANDHLQMIIDDYVARKHNLRPLALFTLARTAIEALAYGIWLLSPEERSERLMRSLTYMWAQNKDAKGLNDLVEDGRSAAMQQRYARQVSQLEHVRDATVELVGRKFWKPVTTGILKECDNDVATHAMTGLVAWKACSALAHGEPISIVELSEIRPVTDVQGQEGIVIMSASTRGLAMVLTVTLDYLEHLLLIDSRARAIASPLRES